MHVVALLTPIDLLPVVLLGPGKHGLERITFLDIRLDDVVAILLLPLKLCCQLLLHSFVSFPNCFTLLPLHRFFKRLTLLPLHPCFPNCFTLLLLYCFFVVLLFQLYLGRKLSSDPQKLQRIGKGWGCW
jgi:hypothetical protein